MKKDSTKKIVKGIEKEKSKTETLGNAVKKQKSAISDRKKDAFHDSKGSQPGSGFSKNVKVVPAGSKTPKPNQLPPHKDKK